MPKPLLSADAIFDEALRVLAEEGAAGLTIRNLAGRLKCSSKTLYQQVGAHEVLVRGVVTRAFAQLEPGFPTTPRGRRLSNRGVRRCARNCWIIPTCAS